MAKANFGIVIPVFNEEKRIWATLKALDEFSKDQEFECCLVDDGSTDGTCKIISRFVQDRPWVHLLCLGKNMGKGGAVRVGIAELSSDFVFFTDADIPVPLHTIRYALNALKSEFDMVIGSRALDDSKVIDRSVLRRFIGFWGNLVIRKITRLPFKDTQCGFKGFRRECALSLFSCLTSSGYLFDVELLILAQRKGYAVKELPIQWSHVPDGSFRPLTDSLRAIWDLIKLVQRYN